jgi:hypothetical protein
LKSKDHVSIAVDSSGVKVHNGGEWIRYVCKPWFGGTCRVNLFGWQDWGEKQRILFKIEAKKTEELALLNKKQSK